VRADGRAARGVPDDELLRSGKARLNVSMAAILGGAGVRAACVNNGQSIWLSGLNDPSPIVALFDYAEAMLDAARALPPPNLLREHVYERQLPFDSGYVPLVELGDAADGLDRLDPVCLMDIDPATARHKVEHNGRIIAFCAPSCKRQFLADPEAYSIA
jgi:YHS domain-containing protein